MKGLAGSFFKQGLLRKALKTYNKVHMYFRTKDAKNNHQKEDEETEDFKQKLQELDKINKTTLSNICIIHSKSKEWQDVLKYSEEALKTDTRYVKAIYYKGRAHLELAEYQKAIEILKEALTIENSEEVKKELARAENAYKIY